MTKNNIEDKILNLYTEKEKKALESEIFFFKIGGISLPTTEKEFKKWCDKSLAIIAERPKSFCED